jgi:hypothetical protein
MATTFVQIGSTANDGTGDPIRKAFGTVNDNFDLINGALFAGTKSSIISAVNVTGGFLLSNTYIYANTWVNANAIIGNTVTSYGNLYVSKGGAYIVGNVTILGNLNVSGSQAASQSQQSGSPIIQLHYSATPLVVNDGKDIGTEFQYYDTSNKLDFFGRQNTTSTLVYMQDIVDTANVITAGTFGNVHFGSLLLSNTTAATSNVTGALQVSGGASVGGNLYVAGNVVSTFANIGNLSVKGYHIGSLNFAGGDTIYINGSPVVTSATAFNGGIVGLTTSFYDIQAATRLGTGAVRVAGGFSANGNVYIGGNVVVADVSGTLGNISANIFGNIITSSQPLITSLGQLTSLTMGGQINSQSIIPELNQTYSLGSSNSNRFLKVWAYDIDSSGTINSAGVVTTGNIAINTGTNAGLTTTQPSAYVFNETASNVRIGGGGVTFFGSNTQSTSFGTGAIILAGGMGVGGNLTIRGSAGNAIVHTGHIIPSSNLVSNLGSTTNWYNTMYGVSSQAKYADLAEKYTSDAVYEIGTVVVFGGSAEITVTEQLADHRVAGVVSGEPAYLMNAMSDGLSVALRGRVPVKVVGAVQKGDLLVTSSLAGYAVSVGGDTSHGIKIFAKSLESNDDLGEKIIEAVIL